MDPKLLLNIVETGGLLAFLLGPVVYGGYKGWWYFGPTVDKQMTAKDVQIDKLESALEEARKVNSTILQGQRDQINLGQQIADAIRTGMTVVRPS